MSILRILLKSSLILVGVTAVGQIRWNDRSLENRYHDFVNSDGFQTWFWAMALPATWTSDQIEAGFASLKQKIHSESPDGPSEGAR